MSFIDKALELAKAQKKREGLSPTSEGISTASSALQQMEPDSTSLSEPVPEICYTTTRIVPVDLNILIRNRLLVGSPNTMVVQNYKLLRTHILQQTLPEHRNALMVTGSLPGEGKTLTAINLAISMAQELDKTVLLVDADLHGPSIHQYFGMPAEAGLVDYLEGRKSIPELLVHPQGLDRLVILPAGQPSPWAPELIRSRRMAELVSELKHCYPDRYVFFDLPPLLSFADALAFAPLVDGILLVVRARKTGREDLVRCLKMLNPFRIIGYVFNDVEFMDSSRYYSHSGYPKRKLLSWLSRQSNNS